MEISNLMTSSNKNSIYQTRNEEKLSIVVPAYNEEENLCKLHSELINVLPRLNISWEIIYVDDGSNDNTWGEITSLCLKEKNTKGIRLSRNFGHQYALFAGLKHAKGDAIISMDADLQHPPEIIPQLVAEWHKGNKIVQTIRLDSKKKIGLFKKLSSRLYYKVFSVLSGVTLEEGTSDFRLLDRQVLDDILDFREEGLFFRGIVQWIGYPSSKVNFQCQDRYRGTSKYTFRRMMKFAFTGITSFSIIPLRIGVIIGIITSILAFGELLYAMFSKLILKTTVPGWASAISVLAFLFGVLFIFMGLIGEYIGRILIEVRARPRFLISEKIEMREAAKKDLDTSQKKGNTMEVQDKDSS